jgi:hypothetical protein
MNTPICKTPGANYRTFIEPSTVAVIVDLPQPIDLTESQAINLEERLHRAIEAELAFLFVSAP